MNYKNGEVMDTKIVKIDRKNIRPDDLKEAASFIRQGKLVAFPTETVYGLGGDALNETSAMRIYEVKGRPCDNPLIVHIADIEALDKLTEEIPKKAYLLAEAFWPGPLTMIFKKSKIIPHSTTGGINTVALRMPSDKIARMLIQESDCFIAAPSANTSGKPSTTRAAHVIEDLYGKIDMIIDGGASEIGLESTVIDLTGDKVIILRPGFITKEQLEKVAGSVINDQALLHQTQEGSVVPRAPGMKYKHYAPKANLIIYEGSTEKVTAAINAEAAKQNESDFLIGIIATSETYLNYNYGIVKSIGSRSDEISITSRLFDLLREFDALGVSLIYTESFNDMKLGHAVMNRLLKASGYQVVYV